MPTCAICFFQTSSGQWHDPARVAEFLESCSLARSGYQKRPAVYLSPWEATRSRPVDKERNDAVGTEKSRLRITAEQSGATGCLVQPAEAFPASIVCGATLQYRSRVSPR